MDINDNIIREIHKELMDTMTQLVRNEEDAFFIIWFDIHSWLEPEMKSDLCGFLTQKIVGRNLAWEVHGPAVDNKPYYQEVKARYAFGKSIDELGEYWKELIREEKPFRLRLLLGCLDVYYRMIMPYVKSEMESWWKKEGCPEFSQTFKPYREHRSKVKATMQLITTVLDIFALQNKQENDCEKI